MKDTGVDHELGRPQDLGSHHHLHSRHGTTWSLGKTNGNLVPIGNLCSAPSFQEAAHTITWNLKPQGWRSAWSAYLGMSECGEQKA